MRTLGRLLLHLHPLTLEDILQRESREKSEVFPKLGYYFIVFRALESSNTADWLDAISQKTGSSNYEAMDGVNVYLVVFRGGICTFHFSNISEHADRVRGKLQTTAQVTRQSSAWIAHGIIDSFFPFVEEIGKEVGVIESVVYNEDGPGSIVAVPSISLARARTSRLHKSEEKVLPPHSLADEKRRDVDSIRTMKTQFSLPLSTLGLTLRRAFFCFIGLFKPWRSKLRNVKPNVNNASSDLRRIAFTRRLVTSLVRVLTTKPEVVTSIRKRLATADRLIASDDAEVGMYFGDIQGLPQLREFFADSIGPRVDHILSLRYSLAHYERMLSQSHPMYLQNLRVDFFRARAKADYAGFIFTIINMLVVLAEVPIGVFLLNVTVPRNRNGDFWWFEVVVVATLCLHASFLGLVRYW